MKTLNENLQLRLLDNTPLEFAPPPGFLPDHMPEHPPGTSCAMCEARVERKPQLVSVRVMSIDGKPTPYTTFLELSPQVVDQIMNARNETKGETE